MPPRPGQRAARALLQGYSPVRYKASQPPRVQPHAGAEPLSRTAPPDHVAPDAVVKLAGAWLARAAERVTAEDAATSKRLAALSGSEESAMFAMRYVDRVARPRDDVVAARQLEGVVCEAGSPPFLGAMDRALLKLAAVAAPIVPKIVVPLARLRMRSLVGGLVVGAEPDVLKEHVVRVRDEGYRQNVNLLGEMVLGDREARVRLEEALRLLKNESVDYVSVKVSGVTAQINPWDHDGSLERVEKNLEEILRCASEASPKTFVNFDMEAYNELELSLEAFMRVLERDEFVSLDAGVVVQAYLPDALPIIQTLVSWSNARKKKGGGEIKIRLVKGANLAMERVEAAMHGWKQAPYLTKAETDANYLRCLDWIFGHPERLESVRLGVASHNLFTLAYAHVLAQETGMQDRLGFEMLQGMAPALASVLREESENGMLLYTPIVAAKDFDVAISYLFRRLEENSSGDNFMRSLFTMTPESLEFRSEEARFKTAVTAKAALGLGIGPRRYQERPATGCELNTMDPMEEEFLYDTKKRTFRNEPDTDPSLPQNRAWALQVLDRQYFNPASSQPIESLQDAQDLLDNAAEAQRVWSHVSIEERRNVLYRIADELAKRRGEAINACVHEGSKVFAEADSEVSEAIDFARFYGDRAAELPAGFSPFGTVSVVSPWNYPFAIPCGGVMASLAAGNSVILKPAPETPRCAEIIVEAALAAGVPTGLLQFARAPENEVGKKLICSSDAVILTGSSETADLFRSWKPDMKLFAETSGKNSMIITPAADVDLAVNDLVLSAFGHAGQKCSATSLCLVVGELANDSRFFAQLSDAAESFAVGPAWDVSTSVGPLISPPNKRLEKALTSLDEGETWLTKPKCLDHESDGTLWTPGVKTGVRNNSWMQKTECFGPVLGIVMTRTLEEAVSVQNNTSFGLTAGLQSLDPSEIEYWKENVEAGNLYINRTTTGAIVCRQPFGGWKKSSVGPGAMTGGPNYLFQLGRVQDSEKSSAGHEAEMWLAAACKSDAIAWKTYFSQEKDNAALFCESNVHRYRPLEAIAVRVGSNTSKREVDRVKNAIDVCGVSKTFWSNAADESESDFAHRVTQEGVNRVRALGDHQDGLHAAFSGTGIHISSSPVVQEGRIELLNYLREQCVSTTLHRFGNLAAEGSR